MLPRRPSNTIATGFCVHPLTTSKWTAPRTCGSLSYARQIGLNAADKVLFIADGAPWIWQRIQRLIAALGLSPTQVLGLIDFYHAAKQLSDAVKLRRWSATQRTRWLNRTRGLLKRARVDEVITALRELCRGDAERPDSTKRSRHARNLNYFLKNRHRPLPPTAICDVGNLGLFYAIPRLSRPAAPSTIEDSSRIRFALSTRRDIVARDANKIGASFKLLDYQIVNGVRRVTSSTS